MKKYIFFLIPLLFINTVYSQVLYEETFDNLTTGDLAPNGATPGHGGWYVTLTSFGEAKVVPEPTKGKVLSAEVDFGGGMHCKQTNIQPIWGNRTAGNNILLLEYDFYAPDLRSEEHTSELQSRENLVCRLLLEKKNREEIEEPPLSVSAKHGNQNPNQQ